MSLGGQGLASVSAVGSDAGGQFIELMLPLPTVPAVGAAVTDFTSGATTSIADPAAGASNSAVKLYLSSTSTFVAADPIGVSLLPNYIETYDGSGKPFQWLRQWPIASLSSVIDLPSGQPYPTSLIVADPELPRIIFVSSGTGDAQSVAFTSNRPIFAGGAQNLQVSYSAGYLQTPPDLSQATIELAMLWFKDRDRLGISGESVLGTHASFYNTSDLLPQTRLKLNYYRRTMRGF
jgi:hypothetical protein